MEAPIRENQIQLGEAPAELYQRIDAEGTAGLAENFVLTSADQAINWARKNSVGRLGVGLAGWAIEMMATSAPRFDIARQPSPNVIGQSEFFRAQLIAW